MARSITQVTQSLKNNFTSINPSLDLAVGPTYDYTMAPVPQEIAYVEAQVSALQIYYSPQFSEIATATQARDLATNFGISVSQGEYARGPITFYRSTPPPSGATLVIALGQLVGSKDYQFLFQTLESKTMLGDFANSYFNPQTQRYEISVIVQAVLPGSVYNLPTNRINQIIAGTTGQFSGVAQLTAMTGGTEPETTTDLARRVVQQFKGINLNSVTGLQTLASRFVPTLILDSHAIRPTDRLEFRRPTTGPAIDLCLAGVDTQTFTEEYFSTGGELSIPLQTSTAIEIKQVRVNNSILGSDQWTFQLDTTPEYQGSTRATNRIEFPTALIANDIVNISGTQNFLLDQVQEIVLPTDDSIFKTDVLVRSFIPLLVSVGITVKVSNTATTDIASVESNLQSTVTQFIETYPVPSYLQAGDLKALLRATVPNVESVFIYKFCRTLEAVTLVETIQPLKNQQALFDVASSTLTVKS